MNFTRRLFLGGLATALAATKVPMSDRAFGSVPVLHGDGKNDDAPALNAWMRGDPVRIVRNVTAAVVGETYAIKGATLLLGSTW